MKQSARGEKGDTLVGVDDADQFIDNQDLEAARDAVVSTRSKTKRKRDDSGGSFLAVTCGNGHIALAGLINSFWCRIVWDSVIVHLSLWEIMSDLAVANLGMENHGVESLWAAPAGLTATAHDALEKAHT